MSLPPNNFNFETASYAQTPNPALQPAAASPAQVIPEQIVDNSSLAWGIVGGIAGAIVGGILYVAFIEITHIQIGYLSIAVAWLVAKGIMMASRAKGGFQYQVTAIVMTCVAVALGNAAMLYWHVSKVQTVALSVHNLLALLRFGIEEPFLEFQDSPFGALLGLFILFIGFRAAWRMTSGDPNAVRHPFSR